MSDPAPAFEATLGVSEAAGKLGVSEDWLYRHASAGEIPSYRYGGRRRFRASELEAWLQEQKGDRVADVVELRG